MLAPLILACCHSFPQTDLELVLLPVLEPLDLGGGELGRLHSLALAPVLRGRAVVLLRAGADLPAIEVIVSFQFPAISLSGENLRPSAKCCMFC